MWNRARKQNACDRRDGFEHRGCDIEVDAIRYAKTRNTHPSISFRIADGLEFVEEGKFDIIVCYETVEHVSDPVRLLSNLVRALHANGKLLISTPISHLGVNAAPNNPYHVQSGDLKRFRL